MPKHHTAWAQLHVADAGCHRPGLVQLAGERNPEAGASWPAQIILATLMCSCARPSQTRGEVATHIWCLERTYCRHRGRAEQHLCGFWARPSMGAAALCRCSTSRIFQALGVRDLTGPTPSCETSRDFLLHMAMLKTADAPSAGVAMIAKKRCSNQGQWCKQAYPQSQNRCINMGATCCCKQQGAPCWLGPH